MDVFKRKSVNVSTRAVATLGTTQNCIYTLNTSGTNISISGGANVQTPKCAMFGKSSNSSALLMNGGGMPTTSAVNLVGNYSILGGASSSVTPRSLSENYE